MLTGTLSAESGADLGVLFDNITSWDSLVLIQPSIVLGAIVQYNNKLYKSLVSGAIDYTITPDNNPNVWEEIYLLNSIDNTLGTAEFNTELIPDEVIVSSSQPTNSSVKIWIDESASRDYSSLYDILFDDANYFDSSTTYFVGDYTIYDNKLYKCTTAHTGAWNNSDFTESTIFVD